MLSGNLWATVGLSAIVFWHAASVGFPAGDSRAIAQPPVAKTAAAGQSTDRLQIPAAKLAAAGIRKLEGRWLTLYTDLPAAAEVDELPLVFDQAIPYWCEYFRIKPEDVASWKVDGSLMRSKEPFLNVGLLTREVPDFLHGYNSKRQIWVLEQMSAYYRRHLILHEGTHAFMATFLGGSGPPWYSEGVAELFGTHRWENGELKIRVMPQRREDVPVWGRITLIKEAIAKGKPLSLEQVMDYGPRAHLEVEPYAWSWAAAHFFETHPATRDAFRELRVVAQDGSSQFSQQFRQRLAARWPEINGDWAVFTRNLDYGFDLARELVRPHDEMPVQSAGSQFVVDGSLGWQSTGLQLKANQSYQVKADGQIVLQQNPEWLSDAGGITIHYHRGFPLGILLGAVCGGDKEQRNLEPLNKPGVIGLNRTIRAPIDGVLYLRANDRSSSLADNTGSYRVTVTPADRR